jgi:hypothetical protein
VQKFDNQYGFNGELQRFSFETDTGGNSRRDSLELPFPRHYSKAHCTCYSMTAQTCVLYHYPFYNKNEIYKQKPKQGQVKTKRIWSHGINKSTKKL